MARVLESYLPPVNEDGIVSNKNFDMSGSTGTFKTPTGTNTFGTKIAGKDLSIGTQFVVVGRNSAAPISTSQVPIVSGGFPVSSLISFVQIIPRNGTAATWEVASITNTKAQVIYLGNTATGTSNYVVGATSLLNAAVAANEILYISSPTTNASATVVMGFETIG